jgi:hypothetical protein
VTMGDVSMIGLMVVEYLPPRTVCVSPAYDG